MNSAHFMQIKTMSCIFLRISPLRKFPLQSSAAVTCPNFYKARTFTSQPPQKPKNFFENVVDSIKKDTEKNSEFQKQLDELKKEVQKMENSSEARKIRDKFDAIEKETMENTEKMKKQLEDIAGSLSAKAQNSEFIKKAGKATEEATKIVSETITQTKEDFSKTQTYKTITETTKIVKEEIDQTTFGIGARVYKAPDNLRMRKERDVDAEKRIIEANTEAMGITLHKDSRFSQSWQDFKNNNMYVQKAMQWKTRIDESDNPVLRASLLFKDKVTEVFGGLFEQSQVSEALTEICKMDPNFDKEIFLLECEYFIIPNILEAMIRPDLKILEDWCFERVFKVISAPVKNAVELGLKFQSKILDVSNVELVMGKILDEGPVLAISFQSQQIMCIKNDKGEAIEGDPSKVMRVNYIWVMCRDQTELNPHTAWRLLDLSAQSSEQLL